MATFSYLRFQGSGLYSLSMRNYRYNLFLAITGAIAISLALTSCGSSNVSPEKASSDQQANKSSQTWIEDWNTQSSLEAKQAFDKLEKREDDFTKESYFRVEKSAMAKIVYGKTNFQMYLISDGPTDVYLPFLSVVYLGKDWKFYDRVMVKIGEDVRELKPLNPPAREVSNGSVNEILDFTLDAQDVESFSQVFTGGEPVFRLYGSKEVFTEFNLTPIELSNLKSILLGHKYLVNSK